MKHNTKRFAAAALTAVLAVGMMTGCGNSGGKGEVTQNGNETLFTYDGEDVSLKKAWIYGKMTAAQYEAHRPAAPGSPHPSGCRPATPRRSNRPTTSGCSP